MENFEAIQALIEKFMGFVLVAFAVIAVLMYYRSLLRADDGTSTSRSAQQPARTRRTTSTNSGAGNGESFATALVVADLTDSTALGYLAGGSLTGAIVGEALAEDRRGDRRSDAETSGGVDPGSSWSDGESSSSSCSDSGNSSNSFDFGSSSDSSSN